MVLVLKVTPKFSPWGINKGLHSILLFVLEEIRKLFTSMSHSILLCYMNINIINVYKYIYKYKYIDGCDPAVDHLTTIYEQK